jgi:hypothetical protein
MISHNGAISLHPPPAAHGQYPLSTNNGSIFHRLRGDLLGGDTFDVQWTLTGTWFHHNYNQG